MTGKGAPVSGADAASPGPSASLGITGRYRSRCVRRG
jgi:hypothetical protein